MVNSMPSETSTSPLASIIVAEATSVSSVNIRDVDMILSLDSVSITLYILSINVDDWNRVFPSLSKLFNPLPILELLILKK